jgi:hypothetical protein
LKKIGGGGIPLPKYKKDRADMDKIKFSFDSKKEKSIEFQEKNIIKIFLLKNQLN